MKAIILVVLAGGCGYRAGSFADVHGPFAGTTETIGCIELGVGTTHDVLAGGPVIAYGFGNRCTHVVTLDLQTVRAVGRDANGREVALTAFDPRGEIRPLPLDALYAGREQIEYDAPAGVAIESVCVDVGGIDASAPRTERWVCSSFHVEVGS